MGARARPRSRSGARLVFRVAASGRIGFGHLTRALHLAAALGVPPRLSIRGGAEARTLAAARGAELVPAGAAAALAEAADLLVIDDPSRRAAEPWLRAARRRGVPVVSVHDLGIAPIASDLAFDASLGARRVAGLGRSAAACRLGVRYAMLSPDVAAARPRPPRPAAERPSVVIGLGGGRHATAGIGVARLLRKAIAADSDLSGTRVLLSLGFNRGVAGGSSGLELIAPERFREALGAATVAVVAGGTTLYEACALGTPAVAVPVVPGQTPAVRRFDRAGLAVAVTGGGRIGSPSWARAVEEAAVRLLRDPDRRRTLAARGRRAVDGRGAARAAREVRRLLARKGTGT